MAASVEAERIVTQPPPCRLDRHRIHPVMLVPINAPSTTGRAWDSFIIPEFTKPTTMAEVAELD